MADVPRILIVGGGCAGLHVALRLQHKLRRGEAVVTVVDARSYSTYQPLLAEAAAGSLEPRHVVVPLRQALRRARVVTRAVASIDHAQRVAHLVPIDDGPERLEYDLLVFAPGSVTRMLPVPGLAENAIGFKTLSEAIYLRNHVLEQLDAASAAPPGARRRALLTFVFVGGGFAGVEALGELADMAAAACARYPEIDPAQLRWLLVEAADRILPEVGERMGRYTVDLLRARGIDVRLGTRLVSAAGGRLVLDDGDEIDAGTLVWTAGVAPNPLARRTDLPVDERGRIITTEHLAVAGVEDAWALGDCAHVPDLAGGAGAVCNRRLRVLADWTLALAFPREIVSLGALQHARSDFKAAADDAAFDTRVSKAGGTQEESDDRVHVPPDDTGDL